MYDAERSSEALVCDPYRGPLKEGVMNSSIAGDTGYPNVKFFAKFVGYSDVINRVGFHHMQSVLEKLTIYPWTY